MIEQHTGTLSGRGGPVYLLMDLSGPRRWKFYFELGLQAQTSTRSRQVT